MKISTDHKETILIVDDSPENIRIVSTLFEKNMIIKAANSGERALEIIQANDPPDLILLDIMMPGIDGYEVARNLKQDAKTHDIPIIFLTAKKDTESLAEGFRIGAQDYVVKPFDVVELKARVETHLELKQKRKALANMNQILEQKVKERTQKLELANKQLAGLSMAKSRFLALISHEMNTPVAVLLGFTEMLEEEFRVSEYVDYIKEIRDAVERIQNFSEKALLITLLQMNEYKINKSPVISIKELIENSVDIHCKHIEKKRLTIDVNVDPAITVSVDYKLIHSCISGLLDNAIRYSPEDEHIQIDCELYDAEIKFILQDKGPGFSQEVLDYSFDLFTLGEDPIKLNFGLHLTTAKLIMEAHNGQIHIQNQKAGGASVTLVFPAT